MRLLIVRHADAGDREEWEKSGQPDDKRPLTKKGVNQMRAAAKGLIAMVPELDVIVTSPYTRAEQTAEIVRAAYGGTVSLESTETLEPEKDPEDFLGWLTKELEDADSVAAVGHEPNLGILATWLMSGLADCRVEMKKGGACLIEFDGAAAKGAGVLQWLLGPKKLARMS